MKILHRHLRKTLFSHVFKVLLILIGLFSFFEFIDELSAIGEGDYTLGSVMYFVLLRVPSLAYDLLPLAGLIGTLTGLGMLVSQNEITVMRSAGISLSNIILSVMRTALFLIIIGMILGEFVVPVSEQHARYLRSIAITQQITLKTTNGLWVRENQNYLNVRQILPGNVMRNIYIYSFDEKNELKTSSYAQSAHYENGKWQLENVRQTQISEEKITQSLEKTAVWDALLKPELLSLIAVAPENLSISDLTSYTRYLKKNNRNNQLYRQAFWKKIIYPMTTGIMIFLALPIVLGSSQQHHLGQRVFIGIVIGLVFHIVNQGMGNLGIVYKLPPIVAVSTPGLITLLISLYLLRSRVH